MNRLAIDKTEQPTLPPDIERAFTDLVSNSGYLDASQIETLKEAFNFAYYAHSHQLRASGDPYIVHPIAVTSLLTELRMDIDTLCAALLHDTVEDNDEVDIDNIKENFGEKVAFLVNSVTKLSDYSLHEIFFDPSHTDNKNTFNDREIFAANLRHLILNSAEDFRALVIKLADRLHNMRTLHHLSQKKQKRIAEETSNIYAPLAALIGMRLWKNEMEDIAFRLTNLSAYKRISLQINNTLKDVNQKQVDRICEKFTHLLRQKGIAVLQVYGRIKTPYSIMRKTSMRNLTVPQLMDIVAFRIIVKNRRDCYRALGAIHSKYRYLQNTFDDYISGPKGNGYRALHTVVFFPNTPNDYRAEIQIRSKLMHQVAETGIAAHWRYKNKQSISPEAIELLEQLNREKNSETMSEMLMQEVNFRSISDEVVAYTPQGHLIRLQKDATVLDFAFQIHTEVGKHFKEALVNDQNVSMGYQIKNGDKVEIITDTEQSPKKFWADHAISPKAQMLIRHTIENESLKYFVKFVQDIARQFNTPMIQRLDMLKMRSCFRKLKVKNFEELEANIVWGKILPEEVLRALQPDLIINSSNKQYAALIINAEDYVPDVQCCSICKPIPGDPILGEERLDKDIIAHREGCPKLSTNTQGYLTNIQLARKRTTVRTDEPEQANLYDVILDFRVTHRPGMLGIITTAIGERGINIQNIDINKDTIEYKLRLYLEVQDKAQIDGIEKTIRARASDFIKISRPFPEL